MNFKHRLINVLSGLSVFAGFIEASNQLSAINAEYTRVNSVIIKWGDTDLHSVTIMDCIYLIPPMLAVTCFGMFIVSAFGYLLGVGFKPWHKE